MGDGLKPYAEYRSSGLLWAKRIPAHWDVRRNARLFAERNETGFPDLPILEVSIQTGVTVRDLQNGKRKQMMTDRAKYKRAVRGDIAYNMMRMWQGAVGTAPVDGLISPAYVVATPFAQVESRYYSYLFRTRAYMNEVNKFSRGIVTDRNRLYWDEFRQMPSIFPSPEEQMRIVDFLDRHAAIVVKFVRTKRRQIELLRQQQLVGIDKALNCADTWSWAVKRLKYVVSSINDQCSSLGPDDIYIALENVESWTGRVQLPDEPVEFDSQVKRFVPGDILFGKLRPYLAKVTRPERYGVCVSEFLVLRRSDPDLMPEFLEQKLRSASFINAVNASTIGAKMPRANWDFIGTLPVSYPRSQNEQRMIIDRIAEENSDLNLAIAALERQIDHVRGFHTRLIADVVTGQLDVRSVACEDLPLTPEVVDAEEEESTDAEEVAVGDE